MEKNKMTLSVAIAVFNEEKHIEKCLASVSGWVDEIIIVDGGSTDRTIEIVKKFTSKIIQTDNPPVFHINKQKALEACTGDWILQLDADEVIPDDLRNEIISTMNDERLTINGYYISRRNYFWGHFMKKGGQYPDSVIRLMRRGKGKFPCKNVHEQIEVSGTVGRLTHPMLHYTYMTRADYWKKSDTYTTLTARDLVRASFIQYCLVKPVLTFATLFIRHKGFMDGLAGFEFSLYSALHFPIAYYKYLKMK